MGGLGDARQSWAGTRRAGWHNLLKVETERLWEDYMRNLSLNLVAIAACLSKVISWDERYLCVFGLGYCLREREGCMG